MPNPIDDEDLYNSIKLAGKRSPGKVTLSGHDRKTDWDIKTGNGQDGATIHLKAIPPIEFTATFQLVKDVAQGIDDFADWPAFRTLINSTVKGKTPKALPIYHPDLADNDIKSIVRGTVGGMVHDGKGGATVAVKFLEYRVVKPAGGKPISKDSPELAAAKAELAKLTVQYEKTPWG